MVLHLDLAGLTQPTIVGPTWARTARTPDIAGPRTGRGSPARSTVRRSPRRPARRRPAPGRPVPGSGTPGCHCPRRPARRAPARSPRTRAGPAAAPAAGAAPATRPAAAGPRRSGEARAPSAPARTSDGVVDRPPRPVRPDQADPQERQPIADALGQPLREDVVRPHSPLRGRRIAYPRHRGPSPYRPSSSRAAAPSQGSTRPGAVGGGDVVVAVTVGTMAPSLGRSDVPRLPSTASRQSGRHDPRSVPALVRERHSGPSQRSHETLRRRLTRCGVEGP